MAHYTAQAGIDGITGALKKKDQARMSITRIKSVKDPITGEVVGHGPKELYLQEQRDYKHHPLTEKEQAQRAKWREACKAAAEILRDKSHPRYMELYHRWRAQLTTDAPCKQFPNFVRAVLAQEKQT